MSAQQDLVDRLVGQALATMTSERIEVDQAVLERHIRETVTRFEGEPITEQLLLEMTYALTDSLSEFMEGQRRHQQQLWEQLGHQPPAELDVETNATVGVDRSNIAYHTAQTGSNNNGEEYIMCLRCGRRSFNNYDVANMYCGQCGSHNPRVADIAEAELREMATETLPTISGIDINEDQLIVRVGQLFERTMEEADRLIRMLWQHRGRLTSQDNPAGARELNELLAAQRMFFAMRFVNFRRQLAGELQALIRSNLPGTLMETFDSLYNVWAGEASSRVNRQWESARTQFGRLEGDISRAATGINMDAGEATDSVTGDPVPSRADRMAEMSQALEGGRRTEEQANNLVAQLYGAGMISRESLLAGVGLHGDAITQPLEPAEPPAHGGRQHRAIQMEEDDQELVRPPEQQDLPPEVPNSFLPVPVYSSCTGNEAEASITYEFHNFTEELADLVEEFREKGIPEPIIVETVTATLSANLVNYANTVLNQMVGGLNEQRRASAQQMGLDLGNRKVSNVRLTHTIDLPTRAKDGWQSLTMSQEERQTLGLETRNE